MISAQFQPRWTRLLHALLGAAVVLPLPVCAADAGRPTAAEIVSRLAPQHTLTRSLAPSRGISVENEAPPPPPSIELNVDFEFNSARLTTDARLTLDQLGMALHDPALVHAHIRVAGHTDAIGSALYNQKLSERRAAAVCAYLSGERSIAAGRLDSVGYGKSHLLDPAHPEAAINRRVEVVNLGNTVAQAADGN